MVAESAVYGLRGGVMWLRVDERFLAGDGVPIVGVWCAEWADYPNRGTAHD